MKAPKDSAHVSALILCSVFGSLDAGLAHAQTAPAPAAAGVSTLQEVVVTAEHRISNVQKTAVSVSVRKGEDLKAQGRYSLQDILQDVPGVVAGPTTDTVGGRSDNVGGSLTIRGLSSSGLARGGIVSSVPAVAVYTDDIYEGMGSDYDIGRVEVLRGPQGTLYGRSATAGVVAFHTNNPQLDHYGADASAELGSYDLQHYSGAVNVPVGDTFAIRIAANRYSRDGYNSPDGGALNDTAARIKLLYRPSADLSVLLGAQFDDGTFHTGGVIDQLTAPNTVAPTSALIGTGNTKERQYWAEVNWNAGPFNVTYLPAFRTFEQNTVLITAGPLPGGLSQPDLTPKDQFLTQELRLSSEAGSKLTWQAGAFYYNNPLTANTSLTFNQTGALAFESSSQRTTENAGVFAEATYPFAERWRFTGGLRYDYTHIQNDEVYSSNVNGFPLPASPSILDTYNLNGGAAIRAFNNVTYKARLEHDLTPVNMAYGMISSGFLPGDVQVSTGAGNVPTDMPFKSETVTSFELGSKNRFFDNTLQLNGDVFYYIYSGYQTNGVNISGNNFAEEFATLNVPMRMYGGELETTYRPTADDQFELDYSYVNAHFINEPAEFTQFAVATQPNNVVPHTVNAAYTHFFHLADGVDLSVHGDGRYLSAHSVSSQFLTPSLFNTGATPYADVGDQLIGDLSATLTLPDKHYSVTAYVRNFTDNRYKTDVLVQTVQPVNVSATLYDPRTVGVILSAHF